MSIEQLMLVSAIAVGHASFAALMINVVHGFGITAWWFERTIRVALLSIAVATMAASFWLVLHPWSTWPIPVRVYAAACLATSLVALPATTLLRAFRRTPAGVTGRSTEVALAAISEVDSLIGAGRMAWALRLPGNESFRLRREEWRVEVPGLPEALDGLSVVQLTDFHLAPCYRRRFFEAVVEEAGRWAADLVVFTGDLIDHDDCLPWIEPIFSRLVGRHGQFAILGNHDYRHDAPALRRELERAGFADLDGRWTRVEIGGTTLALGGTSAPWGPTLDPSVMPEADCRILLSHTPDLLYQASTWGVDLMLSGHNHGGQIRFPVVGPILMPSRYSRRFDQGFFRHGPTLLYVGRGVGGKEPIRYGAPPEITRFILQPARRTQATSVQGPHSQAVGLLSGKGR